MIKNFELENKTVLGFDSGLDSRSFAQAKLARFIVEPGFIVRGNNVELWPVSGVTEVSSVTNTPDVTNGISATKAPGEKKPTMVVWGPSFAGERLDLLLNKSGQQDKTLAVIARWIQAVLTLKEKDSQCSPPLWPCAAIIGETAIFFAPSNLAWTCMTAVREIARFSDKYVHPGFTGMDAAAFTAAVMLYHTLIGTPPFTASDETILHQDMWEGNFLPVRFAAPDLDPQLSALIQNALSPVEKRTSGLKGERLLNGILEIIQAGGQTVSAASLIKPLPHDERLLLEKEKARYFKIGVSSLKAKRFVTRNKAVLMGALAAAVIAAIISISLIKSRSALPSTAGMDPVQVIESYYNAFGELDHQMMDACVLRDAGKNDITMVINFFVISKMREAYERDKAPVFIPASLWQQGGSEAFDPRVFQVFGITDLIIEQMAEGGTDTVSYQANYTLWVPAESTPETALPDTGLPIPQHRSDLITLVKQKECWRIAEIQRF